MGQHKYNPVAIAAKNGELPPKKLALSSNEAKRLLRMEIATQMFCHSPETIGMMATIGHAYR